MLLKRYILCICKYDNRRIFYEKADFIVDNDDNKIQVLEKIKSKIYSYAK